MVCLGRYRHDPGGGHARQRRDCRVVPMRRVRNVPRWRGLIIMAAVACGAALVVQAGPGRAGASTLPPGFRDSVVLSGLSNPTVLQFASDGRIFVGQKNGVIKVFQSLTDTSPVTVADLSGEVDDYW